MVAVTAPRGVVAGRARRPLLSVFFAGIVGVVKKRRVVRPGRGPGVLYRLVFFVRDMLGSVAGLGALTVGMWHVGTVAGWVTLGASILLLDFQLGARRRDGAP